jgi:hypothetical protein
MENEDLRLGLVLLISLCIVYWNMKKLNGGDQGVETFTVNGKQMVVGVGVIELSLPRDPLYSCSGFQMENDYLRLGLVLLISLCIVYWNMKKLNGGDQGVETFTVNGKQMVVGVGVIELSLPRDPLYSCSGFQMENDYLRLGLVLLISLCIVYCNIKN